MSGETFGICQNGSRVSLSELRTNDWKKPEVGIPN